MEKPQYPVVLTDKDWQKKKGLLAKLSIGETGVGAKLKGVEAAYGEVPWEHFKVQAPYNSIKQWTMEYQNAQKAFTGQVQPLIAKVRQTGSDVDAKRAELEKKKASADVLKALDSIYKACEPFLLELKNMGDVGKEFEKVKPAEQQVQQHQQKLEKEVNKNVQIGPIIENARSAAKGWMSTGAMDEPTWNKVRALGALIGEMQQFASIKSVASTLMFLGKDKVTNVKEHGQKVLVLVEKAAKLAPKG